MLRKKDFAALGLVTFLLVFSALVPVVVNSWANPLATDPTGDGEDFGDDILSVDAQLANGFVYGRFKMNEPLMLYMWYYVLLDIDKNVSTGGTFGSSDIGWDAYLYCEIIDTTPDIIVEVFFSTVGASDIWVRYNMTNNNGSAMTWSDPSAILYLDLAIFANGSQGDVAYGVSLAWLTAQVALEGIVGDGISMYLEFYAGWDSDWCPDRTGGNTDYIEWDFSEDDGIPGFSAPLALFCLLTVLAVIVLLDRKRIKV